jgi:hypothetical protein
MLTPSEFEHWYRELQFSPSTCDVIAAMHAAPPARRVTSRTNSVSGVYLSRNMGVTIQFEGHTVELWAIYLLALLKKVPLRTDAETLVVKHWLYFYERCIGWTLYKKNAQQVSPSHLGERPPNGVRCVA